MFAPCTAHVCSAAFVARNSTQCAAPATNYGTPNNSKRKSVDCRNSSQCCRHRMQAGCRIMPTAGESVRGYHYYLLLRLEFIELHLSFGVCSNGTDISIATLPASALLLLLHAALHAVVKAASASSKCRHVYCIKSKSQQCTIISAGAPSRRSTGRLPQARTAPPLRHWPDSSSIQVSVEHVTDTTSVF